MELQRKYNEVLQRHDKGAKYLDNMNIPPEQKEKWADTFRGILQQMNEFAGLIAKERGGELTDDEILNGFSERMCL